MADGDVSNDGHGGVPSNYEQDNNAQERRSSTNRSTRAVRGRRRRRGLVPQSGRVRPTNARNLINPNVQAGPTNVGGASRVVHAPGVAIVGGVTIAPIPLGVGNPVAIIQGDVANAGGAGAIGPLAGVQVVGVPPAGRAVVQLNLAIGGVPAMVAPPGPGPVQPNFNIEDGLSGPPLRRSEVGAFF